MEGGTRRPVCVERRLREPQHWQSPCQTSASKWGVGRKGFGGRCSASGELGGCSREARMERLMALSTLSSFKSMSVKLFALIKGRCCVVMDGSIGEFENRAKIESRSCNAAQLLL